MQAFWLSMSLRPGISALVVVLAAANCWAQGIAGTVYDQDGGLVSEARVLLMQDGWLRLFRQAPSGGRSRQPGPRVVLTSPDEELEKEAVRAASKLRYEPMRLNGRPVESRITLVLDFRLE